MLYQEYAMWLSLFLILNKHLENKILLLCYPRVKKPLNGKQNIIKLEQYMGRVDTSLYKDLAINRKYFKHSFIYTLDNEMREILNEMHRKI